MTHSLINATADSIAKGLKNATWRGQEHGWTASCPTDNHQHGDRSAGLRIKDGDTGVPILACAKCSNEEIFAKLADMGLWAAKGNRTGKKPATKKPAPQTAARPASQDKRKLVALKSPSTIKAEYPYYNADGELVFEVWRKVIKGEKTFEQHVYLDGAYRRAGPSKEERVLYKLPELLAADRSRVVLILEGEKDVDRATEMGLVATCNPGGSGKWEPQYSEALRDRHVVIIPDNDDAGRKHVERVGRELQDHAASVRVLELPGLPEKGDFFDWVEAGGTKDDLAGLLKGSARDWTPVEQTDVETGPDEVEDDAPWEGEPDFPEQGGVELDFHGTPAGRMGANEQIAAMGFPFTVLGVGGDGRFYFQTHSDSRIWDFSLSALGVKTTLFALAPYNMWEQYSGGEGARTGISADLCAALLIAAARERPTFDPDNIRGRGVWWDDKRAIVHAGDRLIVNGAVVKTQDYVGEYCYPAALPLRVEQAEPMSAGEAATLLDAMRLMTWGDDMHPVLAAGWTVCASIGGVLDWRPHIWITGQKGSGKTWFMENIVKPALGKLVVGGGRGVTGSTTAAGVRQALGHDSLAVVFDEAEGTDNRSITRIQDILELARSASSGEALTMKGSAGGVSGISYCTRSCFAFSSINPVITQNSDKSRIAILDLKPGGDAERFTQIKAASAAFRRDDFAARLFARNVQNIPTIRAAALEFSLALSDVLIEQRAMDQFGALLAGAWSLEHDRAPTPEEAATYVAQFTWTEEREEVEDQDDAANLLQSLLAQTIRVELSTGGRDITIAEAITACGSDGENNIPGHIAQAALNRHGLRVGAPGSGRMEGLIIANSGPKIAVLFRDTPASIGWNKVLCRLPGAMRLGKTSFGSKYLQAKALRLPFSTLDMPPPA